MLVKLYGAALESAKGRHNPAECAGAIKTPISGDPDPQAHFNVLSRAQQSQRANAQPQNDAADERVFKEDEKPRARDGSSLPLLQLRSHP